jgi:hypothetical protein
MNINIPAPKIWVIEVGPETPNGYIPKKSVTILIKFREFMDTVSPNKIIKWYI